MDRLDDFKKKGIDPSVMQIILLDEMCGRLEDLGSKLDDMKSYNTNRGPMPKMFKRELQYQYATIPAGSSGQIYYLKNPQPDILMGIITQVANDWYPDTFLEWYTDYYPKKVEYVIGRTYDPKHYERGIPFEHEVKWTATNNDDEDHTFGVLCDGYFLSKEHYFNIIGE